MQASLALARFQFQLFCGVLFAVTAMGCCNGFVCSQRLVSIPGLGAEESEECSDCKPGGVRQKLALRKERGEHADVDLVPKQHSIRPVHSKFHPVPTRPVFVARAEYEAPVPLNVKLHEVPQDEPSSAVPREFTPDQAEPLPKSLNDDSQQSAPLPAKKPRPERTALVTKTDVVPAGFNAEEEKPSIQSGRRLPVNPLRP